MRVGTILEAEKIPKTKKLLKLTVDLGEEKRTVMSGIAEFYQAEDVIGQQVTLLANLAPRKMRFGVSEGMVLAAGPGGEDIFLLSPDEGAEAGMRVK